MSAANFSNRTMWTGDNLDIMRGMNSECVDLIYLDPPFNSNRTYSAPVGSEAAGAAFKDTWTLDDIDLAWHGEIADREPALYAVIDAAGAAHGAGMKSYTIMMAVRLLEMKRILKDAGSLYLHCDPTASHYLKLTMDAVFGKANFRNEIAWHYGGPSKAVSNFPKKHDAILLYSKSSVRPKGRGRQAMGGSKPRKHLLRERSGAGPERLYIYHESGQETPQAVSGRNAG